YFGYIIDQAARKHGDHTLMNRASSSGFVTLFLTATLLLETLVAPFTTAPAAAIGLVPTVPAVGVRARAVPKTRRVQARSRSLRNIGLYSKVRSVARAKKPARKAPAKPAVKAPLPQDLIGLLNTYTIRPGVVHKFYNGPLSINLVDIDMVNAKVEV